MKYNFMWTDENYNYYDFEAILLNYGIRSKSNFGCGIKNGLLFGKEFHAEFYLPKEELDKEAECWYKLFINKDKFDLWLKQIKTATKELNDQIKQLLKTDLSRLSNNALFETYDTYNYKLGSLFGYYVCSQPHRIAKLENELKSLLNEKKIVDIIKVISILTAPKHKFIFLKAGNKLIESSFAELVKGEEKEIDRSLLSKKIYKIEKADQKIKNSIIKELNLSEKIVKIADILGIIAEERLKMRFAWMPAAYYSELFLIEIKRRFYISKKDLRAYENNELQNLIRYGRKVDNNILEIRRQGFLKLMQNSKIKTFQGEEAKEIFSKLVPKVKEKSVIKGSIASPGYAKGRVVVLSYRNSQDHSKKIQEMKKGDILVTEMTHPNIIAACEKAGAIVTDEGGITCHAAIVAREMKKPCIIGTKIATKILKDDDMVEVDANKGTIRKL